MMDNKKALEITIDRLESLKKYKHTYTQKEIVEETLEYLEYIKNILKGRK